MSPPDVYFSDHVDFRWLTRVGLEGPEMNTAWEESVPIESEFIHGHPRLHEGTDTILVMKGNAITTVLHAVQEDYERIAEEEWGPEEEQQTHTP